MALRAACSGLENKRMHTPPRNAGTIISIFCNYNSPSHQQVTRTASTTTTTTTSHHAQHTSATSGPLGAQDFLSNSRLDRRPQIPIIELFCRRHLYINTSLPVSMTITYLAEGAFNKLYTVSASTDPSPKAKAYVFRVSLPVEPFYKTTNEVATLAYIHR